MLTARTLLFLSWPGQGSDDLQVARCRLIFGRYGELLVCKMHWQMKRQALMSRKWKEPSFSNVLSFFSYGLQGKSKSHVCALLLALKWRPLQWIYLLRAARRRTTVGTKKAAADQPRKSPFQKPTEQKTSDFTARQRAYCDAASVMTRFFRPLG